MKTENILNGINTEFIKNGSKSINSEDVKNVIDRAEELKGKVFNSSILKRFIDDVKLLLSLIKDYWSGAYKEIPWWCIAAVAFTLLYVLSPVDLIPDFIPIIGLLDDALVISICLMLIEEELLRYQSWKEERKAAA